MTLFEWQIWFFFQRCFFNQLAVWSAFISGLYSVLHSVSPALTTRPVLLISFVYDKIIVWHGMIEGGREGERETESRLHMRSTLEICIDKA